MPQPPVPTRFVALDETTGEVLAQATTGQYPDGLAYDECRNAIWTTSENRRNRNGGRHGHDTATLQPRGTVELGGQSATSAMTPEATGCWSPCRATTSWR